jgi:serine/threonine protein kinase
MSCPACGSVVPSAARFCPSCGSAVDSDSGPTLGPETTPRGADSPRGAPGAFPRKGEVYPSARISSSSGYEARYVPGTTLADRYRIVSPLGKGGMGEVYRAEDLKLGQPVALKFLPRSLAQTDEALERFKREVRLARQVSHPNVCRVFRISASFDPSSVRWTPHSLLGPSLRPTSLCHQLSGKRQLRGSSAALILLCLGCLFAVASVILKPVRKLELVTVAMSFRSSPCHFHEHRYFVLHGYR